MYLLILTTGGRLLVWSSFLSIALCFLHALRHRAKANALILFLLCDTVIGLQVASGAYLPIPESSLLHRIIFMDLNLAWLFYLPSQVLISLHAAQLTKRDSS